MRSPNAHPSLTPILPAAIQSSNPPSVAMQLVSRCVGHDRLVEEFIFGFTHDRMVDWMLPGVPPTGKKVSVPFTGAVSFRGDRLFYEHISW